MGKSLYLIIHYFFVQRLSLSIFFLCVCSLICLSQDERQYAFAHYGTDKGLAGYEVKAVVQDEAGYMWVGTATGLQRFDGTRFISVFPNQLE
jgi:ligand-binding sensor domain-containing protein